MSEATPFNHQGQSESTDSTYLDWENPFSNLIDETDEIASQEDATPETIQFKAEQKSDSFVPGSAAVSQTNEFSPRRLRLQSAPSTPPLAHVAAIAAWSENMANQAEPPDLADLISLIQELNQCNSILLDRVSHLEEALEHSQATLQSEGGRSPDYSSPATQTSALDQEQTTSLFNQLEFAHQTNQRQQILIETLTGQVENSQERVAQLEREAALIQQRYNEQAQLLSQSENTCRDLQARLQRQQRYTLQFKAALEKCLEVPTPQYEVGADVATLSEDSPFIPKVQRIQPWSSQSQFSLSHLPWTKVDSEVTTERHEGNTTNLQTSPNLQTSSEPQISSANSATHALDRPSHSKIAKLKLPTILFDSIQVDSTQDSAEADFSDLPPAAKPSTSKTQPISQSAPQPVSPAPARPTLNQLEADAALSNPALLEKLDAAVQPLADLFAEAMLSDTRQPNLDSHDGSPSAAAVEMHAQFANLANESATASPDASTAEDLLKAFKADAEDALWQDLARLIDASTEDVVKASLSGDFSAFEAIDFEAVQQGKRKESGIVESDEKLPETKGRSPHRSPTNLPSRSQPSLDEPRYSKSILPPPTAAAQQMAAIPVSPSAIADSSSTKTDNPSELPDLAANSSWPSPIVYPLRPTKKRQSLAMVDLPTFQHHESSDSLVT